MSLNILGGLGFFLIPLEFGINWQYVCVLCNLNKYTEQMEQLFSSEQNSVHCLNQKKMLISLIKKRGSPCVFYETLPEAV